jgi:hypothetical protein
MSLLEIPFLSEFIFVLSTMIFLFTLYAVLPGFIYEKRTLYNHTLTNVLWYKIFNESMYWFFNLFKDSSREQLVEVPVRNEQLNEIKI